MQVELRKLCFWIRRMPVCSKSKSKQFNRAKEQQKEVSSCACQLRWYLMELREGNSHWCLFGGSEKVSEDESMVAYSCKLSAQEAEAGELHWDWRKLGPQWDSVLNKRSRTRHEGWEEKMRALLVCQNDASFARPEVSWEPSAFQVTEELWKEHLRGGES